MVGTEHRRDSPTYLGRHVRDLKTKVADCTLEFDHRQIHILQWKHEAANNALGRTGHTRGGGIVESLRHLEGGCRFGPKNWLDNGSRGNHAHIDTEPVHVLDHPFRGHHLLEKRKQMRRQFVMTAICRNGVRKTLIQYVPHQEWTRKSIIGAPRSMLRLSK